MVLTSESVKEDQLNLKAIVVVTQKSDVGERLIQAIRAETPYHPLRVADGRAALEIVRGVKPHLFLLDTHLPDMTGFELYDQLHHITGLEEVPALFLPVQAWADASWSSFTSSSEMPFEWDHLLFMMEELFA